MQVLLGGIMQRIVIWFQGNESPFLVKAINILFKQKEAVHIIGITGEFDTEKKFCINNVEIPFISLDLISPEMVDYILISENNIPITKFLQIFLQRGFEEECIIRDRTICIPGFSFLKYKYLKESKLSILSINCVGGIISHLFALPFRSPFINLYMNEKDFLTLLENDPRYLLNGELKLYDTGYEENLHIEYPIYEINGLLLNMNHYSDFKNAEYKWYKRVQRINWYNLLIMMYTDSKEILTRFDKLPFAKKVCFVPFESDFQSAYSFDKEKLGVDYPTWNIANRIAGGHILIYDLWDMIMYGKKTRL